jgi:hypothetical protein
VNRMLNLAVLYPLPDGTARIIARNHIDAE